MVIGGNMGQCRTLEKSVNFHELGHEALCVALIGLSEVLLHPGRNSTPHDKHFACWSWCGELLLNPRSELFSREQHEIRSLYATSIHAALAEYRRPPTTKDEWFEQNRVRELQPHHAKQFLQESNLVLAYLSFPLLEAVLKRSCATYVTLDGKVISPFEITTKGGGKKNYIPNTRSGTCSSLRDLLFLHSTTVASPKLKTLVDRFRIHLQSLDPTQDPFDLLYSWRNQSLHGSTNFHTIGGTVLNLSLLIMLFEIENSFEEYRLRAIEHYQWDARSENRSPWSFYPPD